MRPRRPPAIDDRLAPPETRVEFLHGVELFAAPADAPHATTHARLAYVLEAHVAPGYQAAVDLLMRTGAASDFAPDASIYPEGNDPKTGGRRLDELAFEVADKQALSVPTKKARELVRRGVRRVFCLLVAKQSVLEWSRETDGWRPVGESERLEDRCLVRPLPVRALLDAAASDEAVVGALRARQVPAMVEALADERRQGETKGRAEGKAEGMAEGEVKGIAKGEAKGKAEAVLEVLEARGLSVTAAQRAKVLGCTDLARLAGWLRQAATAEATAALFAPPKRGPTTRR
ncbi:MAG TPA: Uma2 family endonuclease [Polyangiaceae bacterium]|nr:Uma2 family endonuclease [Polyangiaceae bacterium]